MKRAHNLWYKRTSEFRVPEQTRWFKSANRILTMQVWVGIFAAYFIQIGAPCVSQSIHAQSVGKVDIGLSGQIDRVLWISNEELLLIRCGKEYSIYASVGNVLHHSQHNPKGLNKQLTETDIRLWALFLSPDGHRLLWSFTQIDGLATLTCDLDGTELRECEEPRKWYHPTLLGWISDHQYVCQSQLHTTTFTPWV